MRDPRRQKRRSVASASAAEGTVEWYRSMLKDAQHCNDLMSEGNVRLLRRIQTLERRLADAGLRTD
jgi:type II secretory pathway component PulJ